MQRTDKSCSKLHHLQAPDALSQQDEHIQSYEKKLHGN